VSCPEYVIVIPARMGSERLPGKPLAEIAGRPLIQHVFDAAAQASATGIVIATDDERIRQAGLAFGAQVLMTSAGCPSGTDRIAECAARLGWPDDRIVVNLQGDEPLMPPECLDQVAALLSGDPAASMASLWWPLQDAAEIADPNIVKVVTAADGAALYFSRSAVPYPRHWGGINAALAGGAPSWRRHVGLYAYRVATLRDFAARPAAPLETAERLEQLRVLEWGGRIVMEQACAPIPAGVDTEADLQRVRSHFTK